MNHLRVPKFRLGGKDNAAVAELPVSGDSSSNGNNNNNNTNNNNNNNANNSTNNNNSKGFLTRIKRYSVLGNKLSRRHLGSMTLPNGEGGGGGGATAGKDHSSKLVTGSYNMTGGNSDDHRLEIGAPILISTTTLDTDRFGVTEERLKQIGGGIAKTSSIVRTLTPRSSDEEEFVDACGTPPIENATNVERKETEQETQPEPEREPEQEPEPGPELEYFATPTHRAELEIADLPLPPVPVEAPMRRPRIARQQQSQSVQNLNQRSELKVFLYKSPSMSLNMTAPPQLGLNLPQLPELYGASELSLAASTPEENKENIVGKDKTNGTLPTAKPAERNDDDPMICGFRVQEQRFRSIESLRLLPSQLSSQRSLTSCRSRSRSRSRSCSRSRSQLSVNEEDFDYDLKSVSYQSLNAQNLFVSIDELQEITRQINETEDFSREIDLEYCQHRDQLRPSERRITLLKNKNQRLISFNHNKEKLRKGWHGMKHWLGEESSKLKEVVRQQTPLKRVAQSKTNLNQSLGNTSRQSLSPERSRQDQDRDMTVSCEDVTERTECDTTFSQHPSEEDLSPHAKRFKDEVD